MMPENTDRSSSGRKKRPRSEEGEKIEESLDNSIRNANRKKMKKTKRRRIQNPNFLPQPPQSASASPSMVLVSGLPEGCSVMALKYRFEMYGPISRTRIDGSEGFITYRSREAADSAVSASSDYISFHSQQVFVRHHQATEARSAMSNLLRSEIPLSKYGRSNKKLSSSSSISPTATNMLSRITRKIIVYDDDLL